MNCFCLPSDPCHYVNFDVVLNLEGQNPIMLLELQFLQLSTLLNYWQSKPKSNSTLYTEETEYMLLVHSKDLTSLLCAKAPAIPRQVIICS